MYIHYTVYDEDDNILADGYGTEDRVRSMQNALDGNIPGSKHMKALPVYLCGHRIEKTYYDTKEEAVNAERLSHIKNGKPSCKQLIRDCINRRIEEVGYMPHNSGAAIMIYTFLIENGDNFTRTLMKNVLANLDEDTEDYIKCLFRI